MKNYINSIIYGIYLFIGLILGFIIFTIIPFMGFLIFIPTLIFAAWKANTFINNVENESTNLQKHLSQTWIMYFLVFAEIYNISANGLPGQPGHGVGYGFAFLVGLIAFGAIVFNIIFLSKIDQTSAN